MLLRVWLGCGVLAVCASACALGPPPPAASGVEGEGEGGNAEDAGAGGRDSSMGQGGGAGAGGASSTGGRNASGGSPNLAGSGGVLNHGGTDQGSRGGRSGSRDGEAGATEPAESAGGSGGLGGGSGAGTAGSAAGSNTGGSAGGSTSGLSHVRVTGRTTLGTMSGERFAWPGTSFSARFTGTQIVMRLADNASRQYAVVVDGNVTRLQTNNGVTRYVLATGLSEGTHNVTVWRHTAIGGPSEFLGFNELSPGGAFAAPPPKSMRRMEIIGDSLVVGSGNAGTAPCENVRTNDDNYAAFGSVAARVLGADLVTIAWPDIGVYRNFGDTAASADAMPARYPKILPNDDSAPNWDFSRYIPHAVVINLGASDYRGGDPGQPFVDAYVSFLATVRRNYPSAYIFCLIQRPESAPGINAAVDARQTAGDSAIESFDINVTEGSDTGCSLQPDLARHAAMGAKLASRIRGVLDWP
jgi:hypothetical protein